ncbi:MAG TPA: LamG domain-containing protein, partial [Polyangia bacterium]|nr:LamG domain-containing protein [Polyangia bacterium]
GAGSVGGNGAGGNAGSIGPQGAGGGGRDGRGGDAGDGARGGNGGGGGLAGGASGGDSGGVGGRGGGSGAGGTTGGGSGMAGSVGGEGGRGGAAGRGGTGGSAGSSGGRGGTGGSAGGTGAAGRGGAGGAGGIAGGGAGSGGATGGGGTGGAPEVDLVLWYKFDESSGTVALDSSTASGAPHNGMLATTGTGTIAFSTTHQVGTHAVALTTSNATNGGYVVVPSLNDLAPRALTISTWVYVNTAQQWQRVFDIGSSTTTNLALTTHNASNVVRFIIRNGTVQQEIISNVTLSLAAWHHLVVVLPDGSPYAGEIYVDGVSVGTNAAMTLHAADLGATTNNFIGKSQFAADPYYSGLVDDFRVYRRALTRDQITALYGAR